MGSSRVSFKVTAVPLLWGSQHVSAATLPSVAAVPTQARPLAWRAQEFAGCWHIMPLPALPTAGYGAEVSSHPHLSKESLLPSTKRHARLAASVAALAIGTTPLLLAVGADAVAPAHTPPGSEPAARNPFFMPLR